MSERGNASGGESDPARRRAHQRGRRAEAMASLFLAMRGYRVLSRRYKTPVGEIDLIVVRGRRVRFVEVKQRVNFALCEASVTCQTRQRVRRAAQLWMSRHGRFSDYDQSFDLIFITPWRLPRHLRDAL